MDGLSILNSDREPILVLEPAGDPFARCVVVTAPRGWAGLGPEDIQRVADWIERFQSRPEGT